MAGPNRGHAGSQEVERVQRGLCLEMRKNRPESKKNITDRDAEQFVLPLLSSLKTLEGRE